MTLAPREPLFRQESFRGIARAEAAAMLAFLRHEVREVRALARSALGPPTQVAQQAGRACPVALALQHQAGAGQGHCGSDVLRWWPGGGNTVTPTTPWANRFPPDRQPTWEQVEAWVGSPLWRELHDHLQRSCRLKRSLEYSRCPAQPGWNVKCRSGSMSLCTLYPEEGSFLTLVVVPPRQEDEAQAMLPLLSPQVQDIFRSARPMAMGRWLMIPVSDSALLEDVKKLIQLRSARRR